MNCTIDPCVHVSRGEKADEEDDSIAVPAAGIDKIDPDGLA